MEPLDLLTVQSNVVPKTMKASVPCITLLSLAGERLIDVAARSSCTAPLLSDVCTRTRTKIESMFSC